MKNSVKMYASKGWQNVKQYIEHELPYKLQEIDVPKEHAHPAMGYTEARHYSPEQLIAALEEAAGEKGLKYTIE